MEEEFRGQYRRRFRRESGQCLLPSGLRGNVVRLSEERLCKVEKGLSRQDLLHPGIVRKISGIMVWIGS